MMLQLFPSEACGNRFLLVRAVEAKSAGEEVHSLARRLCGSSFDGLLVLGLEEGSVQTVRILNRDGSDGGACLNGLRAAACLSAADCGRMQMSGYVVEWRRVSGGFELLLPEGCADLDLKKLCLADGREGHAVDFWNPHAVFPFAADEEECSLMEFDLRACAELCRQQGGSFPAGVNVELVEGLGFRDELRMRVEERGVGETAACGSGALAVANVAWVLGAGDRIGLRMKGGRLELERSPRGTIRLRGTASVGPGKSLAELLRGVGKSFIDKDLG